MFFNMRCRKASPLAFAVGMVVASVTAIGNTVYPPFGNQIVLNGGVIFDGTGTLDLGTHDLLIFGNDGNQSAVFDWVKSFVVSARAGGSWTGQGITSSAAAADPRHLTGLAVILNNDGNGNPLYNSFDGVQVDRNTTIVKYTWNGDADLSGKVDASDYFLIDLAYATHLKGGGYHHGDFDYNGAVDSDDYFLIDCAYLRQTGKLADADPLIAYPSSVPPTPAVPLPSAVWAGMVLLGGLVVVKGAGRRLS
jgi:hypothetical protein